MSPEEAREAMLDAAMSSVDKKNRPQWAYEFDYLTRRGFSISLASVRDHTNCLAKPWGCGGTGTIDGTRGGEPASWPCTDARPVVWSASDAS